MYSPDNFFKIRADNRTENTSAASNETSGVKPKKAANARKEFKEVMGEKKESLDDSEMAISDNEETKETPLMSLFSQPKTKKESVKLKDLQYDESSTLSILDEKPLAQTKKVGSLPSNLKSDVEAVIENSTSDELDRLAKKGKFNSEFVTAAPDLAAIIPTIPHQDMPSINLSILQKVEQTIPVASPIHDIVVNLIDKLMIVEKAGQKDTVVTLNMPGMFKGAIVVISEFDTANGQLNLAFENLRTDAKRLLDSLPNKEALLQVLTKEGYTVQQYTTTTIIEHRPIISDQATERERRGESEEKNEQKKRNQE